VSDPAVLALIRAIASGDRPRVRRLLEEQPALASMQVSRGATRQQATDWFLTDLQHYVYAGDGALHITAAAYDAPLVRRLVRMGADVGAANRRGARALHYAADGGPGSPTWNPRSQRATITRLLEAGADADARDKSGTTPLLRAVRNRCAAAVEALLAGGADPRATNNNGSTAMQLAQWTTGRGGSGTPQARAQQRRIVELLRTATN